MFQVYSGTLTSSATGLNLGLGGGTAWLLGSIIRVRNAGAGIVTVTVRGVDTGGAWTENRLTLNLALLGVGVTVRDVFPFVDVNYNIVIDIVFTGIIGTPSLDFTFGVA